MSINPNSNQICVKCGKPFFWTPNQSTSAVPDICQGHEADPVAAFKERLRKHLNERYFEMDAALFMAPSQFGKLLKLIDETP